VTPDKFLEGTPLPEGSWKHGGTSNGKANLLANAVVNAFTRADYGESRSGEVG
jgi:hypothetical protein